MADKKTFANKDTVGTPRGYVKKKDIERVDREMTPILEGATGVLATAIPLGRVARLGTIMYRAAKAGKAVKGASEAAKVAGSAGRRYAPKGAKQVVKEAPKKSDGTNKVLAGLGGATAIGYGASKMFPARKGETVGKYPARKPGGARPETPGSYPASKLASKVEEINKMRKDPNDLRSGYGDTYKSYIEGPTGVYPRPKAKPEAKNLGSAKAPKTFAKESTKSVESSSKMMINPTQRAYDKNSPSYSGFGVAKPAKAVPIPKAKPAVDKSRVAGKSKTRIAFEQEFAKQRKAGKKEFTFRGKRYTTKLK